VVSFYSSKRNGAISRTRKTGGFLWEGNLILRDPDESIRDVFMDTLR